MAFILIKPRSENIPAPFLYQVQLKEVVQHGHPCFILSNKEAAVSQPPAVKNMIYSLQKTQAVAYTWPTNMELFSKGWGTTQNGKVICRILQFSLPSCYRSSGYTSRAASYQPEDSEKNKCYTQNPLPADIFLKENTPNN